MSGWGMWRSRRERSLGCVKGKGRAPRPVGTDTMPRFEGLCREGWRRRTLGNYSCLMSDPAVFGVESIETWVSVEDLVVSV